LWHTVRSLSSAPKQIPCPQSAFATPASRSPAPLLAPARESASLPHKRLRNRTTGRESFVAKTAVSELVGGHFRHQLLRVCADEVDHGSPLKSNLMCDFSVQWSLTEDAPNAGRLDTFQPPPSALIRRTLASNRRRRISMAFRSLASSIVCAVITWRYVSTPPL